MTLPAVDEEPDGWRSDLHCLAGYPRYVTRIRTAKPIWTDAIVKAEGVQAELEGAHVKRSMGAVMILTGGRLSE